MRYFPTTYLKIFVLKYENKKPKVTLLNNFTFINKISYILTNILWSYFIF